MEQSPLKSNRGRPRLDITEEERRERRLSQRKKTARKYQNVSIDADILDRLHDIQADLETKLGVRLSLSQTVRHLIHLHTHVAGAK